MSEHEVQQGECMSSIAFQYKFHWETIWNHPQNFALKTKRKNPDALFPGDIVYIPEKGPKEVDGATDRRHRFQLKGFPVTLKLRLLRNDEPRANEKYVIAIAGQLLSGQTDADGRIEQKIPPDAQEGKLILRDGKEVYPLVLGHIDPIDEVSGIQGRLRNLGFYNGEADGDSGPVTEEAIRGFQRKHGLPETGQADEGTIAALKGDFGH